MVDDDAEPAGSDHDIWLNGEIELRAQTIDGVDYAMLLGTNSETGHPVRIGFRMDAFTAIIDMGQDFVDWHLQRMNPPPIPRRQPRAR